MAFAIPHPARAAAAVLLTMFASLGLVGCDAAEELADPGSSYVTMYDNAFSPPLIRVPVGSRVTWFNAGRNPHNAIADDWSWSTEKDYGNIAMPAGASASVPFPEQGVFPYFCNFHGAPGIGMIGVVVVGDAVYEPSAARGLEPVSEPTGVTRRVPQEYPTIQAGVDAASPGDLVLVDRGVYREEVMVTTPSLVIRCCPMASPSRI
jgi:plastocyanin